MITMTYSDAQEKLAEVLDRALEQPVMIVRRLAPDVVVISAGEYEAYQQAKFEAAMARVKIDNHDVFKTLAEK